MLEWTSRSSTVIAVLGLLVVPSGIRAQQLDSVVAQEAQTPAATPQQGTGQKVAAGEEPSKPTRSFIPALFHNLGDDVKHIPRRNTLYWLAWGTGVSLAIHPADARFPGVLDRWRYTIMRALETRKPLTKSASLVPAQLPT